MTQTDTSDRSPSRPTSDPLQQVRDVRMKAPEASSFNSSSTDGGLPVSGVWAAQWRPAWSDPVAGDLLVDVSIKDGVEIRRHVARAHVEQEIAA